ncbi:retrovirus-related pol polyprotein from transposon TNT 1-94, partial [Tanacetum coccineum]
CVVLSLDFKLTDENHVLLKVPRKDNMYNVDLKNVVPQGGLICLFSKATIDESNLWHRRPGHKGKQHRASCKTKTVSSISQPLQMLHMDLFGPTFVKSLMKKMYCLIVTDDFSRFSWDFFLATKDKTSEILKTFITSIENLIDLRVKVIRCDNGTEFKNRVMNQFYEMKGIKREFSVARTPQQNGVAERKNKTLIEAARTMLADSKLPTTLWTEAVNTACYVQNRVLVIKPHNKTPYELFLGRKHVLSFMRPFGCPATILNTIDHLGKARMETVPGKDYILLLMCPADPLFSQDSKSSPNAGFKPSGEEEKKDAEDPGNEDSEVPSTEEPRINQDKDDNINSTNNINTASDGNNTNNVNAISSTVNAAGIKVNAIDPKTSIKLPNDLNMPELEDIVYSNDDDDVGAEDDMNNLDAFMHVSAIPTTRIHKDHPDEQIIRDLNSTPQTRRMTKNLKEHEEPKKIIQALKNPSWIEAMQDELLQFRLQKVWTLVDLPNGKRAIGPKWVYKNKNDERGIMIKNKSRLVAEGYTQEEGIDYDKVFALVARIEAIRLFLAYASFKDFVVYQMDVNTPRAWYETLSTYLLDNGFQRGNIDKTLFIRRVKSDILLVQVYVDDIIFGSTKKSLCTEFEKMMHKKFQMSSMGKLTFFLGLQVKQKEDGDYKDSTFDLEAYTDSDYAGASLDRKSTIGGCKSLERRLISWQCKKQTIIANSTTEAEYVAASSCCGQVLWNQNQMLDYGYNFMNTKIFIDNESTICIVKNLVFHSKTTHIEIRHHFIRDSYEKKLNQVIKIHIDQNVADLLTKAFDVNKFQYLIASIGMLNL